MKFSLVLATVDRTDEVERFLISLEKQTHKDFELIVVDQNPEGTFAPLLEPHKVNFPIVHLARPDDRGVSKSRNAGIQRATGEVLKNLDIRQSSGKFLFHYLEQEHETA